MTFEELESLPVGTIVNVETWIENEPIFYDMLIVGASNTGMFHLIQKRCTKAIGPSVWVLNLTTKKFGVVRKEAIQSGRVTILKFGVHTTITSSDLLVDYDFNAKLGG